MCDQRRLRPACAYAQSDQSLCKSLEYFMNVEHHMEFLNVKGGCTGLSESTLVKMPLCWKSNVTAQAGLKTGLHAGPTVAILGGVGGGGFFTPDSL